jgi:hypothetical protein
VTWAPRARPTRSVRETGSKRGADGSAVEVLLGACGHEDISDNAYKEQSVWAYVEGQYWNKRDFRIKLRYELFSWIDDRDSTKERVPNPAHWLRIDLEYRF